MKNVTIFVDVQNIYYTTKQSHHCHFNYNAFWQTATANRNVVKAIAYAIDKGDEKQIKFQNILKNIGFEIKLKPYIQRSDGSSKGDWDVGITIDVLDYAQHSDIIVLASGDGDFEKGYFLQLSGAINIVLDTDYQNVATNGTHRYWQMDIQQWQLFQLSPNTSWETLEYSPYNP